MPDAIVIKSVTKTFGPKVAVRDLNLNIPTGSLCGFIGPNGAGKTTTIRMIMSIIFPDSGELSVLGRPSAVESKDRIGYLPEERGVYRKMKVLPFLVYMGRLKGLDARGLKPKVMTWLERMNLADCARKRCEELSKGMQQKAQFIAAVLHEPELLILDEPFSGLDPVNRRLLRTLIHEQNTQGRTIIFSTHAMYEAEQLCDRILMIHEGLKVLDDGLDHIRARFDPHAIHVETVPANGDGRVAELRLETVPGIREIARVRGGFDVILEPGADVRRVMSEVVREAPIRRVELKRVSLEDVFIDLVEASGRAAPAREELRADAPEEAATSD